ncbi:pentatricopeptide repeat-containing protein At4g21065-like [Amborella trichopoda]|uniref:pentatricopeptide repeat-containing protein At4g21065-like n=1 Tax=Amborella trichopoda TaxID=13333 RepID=UPI0005D34D0D|nr:pentatricopeptide repeat-containing protein At4g21065-like [Amborella trichopoda]|eukprot:XP_011624250.1 pentatricopeptide repeat-containing protein At4g21065-like [Amborella trichopoda]
MVILLAKACTTHVKLSPTTRPPDHSSPISQEKRCFLLIEQCNTLTQLRQAHASIIKSGLQHRGTLIAAKLLAACISCHSPGNLDYALCIFNSFVDPSPRSWNTIIRGFADHGTNRKDAISLFRQMLELRGSNNDGYELTLPSVLKSCSKAFALFEGEQIHGQAIKRNLGLNLFVQTAILSLYLAHGVLALASQMFERMPVRSVVSWTAMIDGYAKAGYVTMGLRLFREMQGAGVKPDQFTIVSLLSMCSSLGALELGRWVHSYVKRNGLVANVYMGTALIDMYCKCGSVEEALTVFHGMQNQNVQSWNSMLHGLAIHGLSSEALKLFEEMGESGQQPNQVTFVALLCACSHGGLVNEGWFYFNSMASKYKIEPNIRHYGCVVDTLGRAGLLNDALKLINKMPLRPNAVVWGALLSGCHIHGNVEIAEHAMDRLIELEPSHDSHYVLMSNLYSKAGRWDEMAKVRVKVGAGGAKKPSGCSWIEIGYEVHEFVMGDTSHSQSNEIHETLGQIMKRLQAERYEEEIIGKGEEREELTLPHHSERLALAFGLLSTSSHGVIRIAKNLRICRDCHHFMKLVSKVFGRDIVVRDCNRFHQFREGLCSCKDYW